jgi:exopolyphosphatase / guanosine-5'-triphosphate,3'-diphosphate pyrophosphatase
MQLVNATLKRMGETVQKFKPEAVRAVATSATRDAGNQQLFLDGAQQALGYPIEVISGREEARLIHSGVQARWPHPNECVLIVDVGGGSAEVLIGDRGELIEAYSKPIGAVRLQQVFLKSDPPESIELRRMEDFIDEKLAVALPALQRFRIDRVIATSATAAATVCATNSVNRGLRDQADQLSSSLLGIRNLYQKVSRLNLEQRRQVVGVGPRRAEIIVPGVAVLLRVLENLQLPSLHYSIGGVRDGIVADLALRSSERNEHRLDNTQRRTIELLAKKFGVQLRHGQHVAHLASQLFLQTTMMHGLPPEDGRLLEAAAHLLDAGHFVSDSAHHKHSYYVVAHSDIEGFTASERIVIAMLCRYHRKSLPKASHEWFQRLSASEKTRILRLIPLLRLADALDQSQEQPIANVNARVSESSVKVMVDSSQTAELETWSAQQVSVVFESIYNRKLEVARG